MTKISKFGEEFLKLALRLNKHNKKYVDFYIGPEYIRQIVDNESILSPSKLLDDSNTLIKQLDKQGYDKNRKRYIFKILRAMKASIELLLGYEIPFNELILKLHHTKLKLINDLELYKLKEDFDKVTESSGSLEARMTELRKRRTVIGKNILNY